MSFDIVSITFLAGVNTGLSINGNISECTGYAKGDFYMLLPFIYASLLPFIKTPFHWEIFLMVKAAHNRILNLTMGLKAFELFLI